MAYNILGINPFHNGSVCVLSDGKVVYYLEEERLTRKKHDANPFKTIYEALNKYPIDEVVIAGIDKHEVELPYSKENPFSALIRKFSLKNYPFTVYSNHHHATHIFHSFFNSGFKDAIGIVIDGGGSFYEDFHEELDTIFLFKKNKYITTLYTNDIPNPLKSSNPTTPSSFNIGKAYTGITKYLGLNFNEEGKVMGLSSYGKLNSLIPDLFYLNSNKSNYNIIGNIFEKIENNSYNLDYWINNNILLPIKNKEWHKDSSKITDLEKDLAWKIQNHTHQIVKNYVKEYVEKTNVKNVVCSGGLFLNCVLNYYLTKEFPDINFYFEPVSHDGGTAIGAAYWRWKELNPKFQPKKRINSIYLGPQYSKEQLLEGIKKYI